MVQGVGGEVEGQQETSLNHQSIAEAAPLGRLALLMQGDAAQ